ncbi:MAG: RND transporter [Deltaproteobacteria bacterium]|nr:RND transporter [Deltaproteobacteria bacterium]
MAAMSGFSSLIERVPLMAAVILALTLGLAPFVPMPHVIEKLGMLWSGNLSRPIDVFDLVLHGSPWVLLGAKLASLGLVKA